MDLPRKGETIRLKLLKANVFEGTNNSGPYHMYVVEQNGDGIERAYFASQAEHEKILEFKLKTGSEFMLKNTENGSRNSYQIILNGNGVVKGDNFKEIMRECLSDAIELARTFSDIPFQNEDIRSVSSCLFIARTKSNGFH